LAPVVHSAGVFVLASIESYITTIEANLDYDLVGNTAKAVEFIKAIRALLIMRPVSVSIGGNPVSFESLRDLEAKAVSWFRASGGAAAQTTASGGVSGSSRYYDLSNIRGR
jgi:hypothetical protein